MRRRNVFLGVVGIISLICALAVLPKLLEHNEIEMISISEHDEGDYIEIYFRFSYKLIESHDHIYISTELLKDEHVIDDTSLILQNYTAKTKSFLFANFFISPLDGVHKGDELTINIQIENTEKLLVKSSFDYELESEVIKESTYGRIANKVLYLVSMTTIVIFGVVVVLFLKNRGMIGEIPNQREGEYIIIERDVSDPVMLNQEMDINERIWEGFQ